MQQPILEKVPISLSYSFALKEEILSYIKIGWHFHPEYELTLFTEGSGTMFIGDHTDRFGPGSLLLLGPHLPHYMRNDKPYYQGTDLKMRAIVIHFAGDFVGGSFFEVPEMAAVKKLLQHSLQGIAITGEMGRRVASRMEALLGLDHCQRLLGLLDILRLLAGAEEQRPLSSIGFQPSANHQDTERIDRIFEYLLQHFTEEINLEEMATYSSMSKSAFCKFFKHRTGKTFTQVLNEIRVGHACRLFIERGLSVSEACYQCGYNSLSYFNRKFKHITHFAPQEYKKRFCLGNKQMAYT